MLGLGQRRLRGLHLLVQVVQLALLGAEQEEVPGDDEHHRDDRGDDVDLLAAGPHGATSVCSVVVGGGVVYGRSCAVTVNCLKVVVVVVVAVLLTSVDVVSVMFMSCGMRPSRVMNSATSRCFSVWPVNVTSVPRGSGRRRLSQGRRPAAWSSGRSP